MAANPTTENRATDQQARNITAYDLVIGILAIFSLVLLIPIYFGNLSSADNTVLNVTTQVPLNAGFAWVRGDSILTRTCESLDGLGVSTEVLPPFMAGKRENAFVVARACRIAELEYFAPGHRWISTSSWGT